MRLFSILLASAFLTVAGCGGDDGTSGGTTPPGTDNTGADVAPPGMDPASMPTEEVKGDDGKVTDEGGKEEAPEGSKLIPKEVTGGAKAKPAKDAPKKDAPKKDAPKKDAPKKDAPKKDAPKKDGDKKK